MTGVVRPHSAKAERHLEAYGTLRDQYRKGDAAQARLLRRAQQEAVAAMGEPASAVSRERLAKRGRVSVATVDHDLREARKARAAKNGQA